MNNTTIAIITARGGSKRIPRKNIKEFCGEPIINYSIKAAINSNIFDEVMVSTDDEEIAKISKKAGANVPFMRSEATSNDTAATHDVLLEVFSKYKKIGKDFKYACCIYPTAPFINPEKLKLGLETLIKTNAAAVNPVIKFSYPPQRCFIIENNYLKYKWPENFTARSQDLEPFYHDAGQFYFYDVEKFIERKGIILEDKVPIILSELEVQDIDSLDDWKIAEIKYRVLKELI